MFFSCLISKSCLLAKPDMIGYMWDDFLYNLYIGLCLGTGLLEHFILFYHISHIFVAWFILIGCIQNFDT